VNVWRENRLNRLPKKKVGKYIKYRELQEQKEIQEKLVAELETAIANIKTLSGFIPICAWCKKIRTDAEYWQSVEQYISEHSNALFTHGICPECEKKLMDEG
jgi:hypothetical protein